MNLKKSTLLVLIGIILTILIKIVKFIIPGLAGNPAAGRIMVLISIFLGIAFILFCIYFIKEYVKSDQKKLKTAALLVIIPAGFTLLLNIKTFFIGYKEAVYSLSDSPSLLFKFLTSRNLEIIFPFFHWLSALFLLYFFWLFYSSIENNPRFKKAGFYAVIAQSFLLLSRTIGVIGIYFFKGGPGFAAFSQKMILIVLPLSVLSFMVILYFLWMFYKSLEI